MGDFGEPRPAGNTPATVSVKQTQESHGLEAAKDITFGSVRFPLLLGPLVPNDALVVDCGYSRQGGRVSF